MMLGSVSDYLHQASEAIEECDWGTSQNATRLLSVKDSHAELDFLQIAEPDTRSIKRTLKPPFDQVVGLHLRVVYFVSEEEFEDAYHTQAKIIQLMIKEVMQEMKNENWFLPLLYTFCADLRLIAKAADKYPSKFRPLDQPSFHEQATGPIMDCYRSCVSDVRASVEASKRLAILNLTNQLFRIYFRINKLNLLKPLIRAVDNCGTLYEHFTMAEKITYKYYVGRKAMFDSDLTTAEEALSFAFKNCDPKSEKNKRLILTYLVPVKMFLGHMPTETLLRKHNLMQFAQVSQAVKEGNLLKLEEAIATHEPFFIQCGIFLILEKLKIITLRTLFKKVCNIMETNMVPLEAFLVALQKMEVEDVDIDEVACNVANLIYQGKIKGYISHQHQKLVISKQNPFPPLSQTITHTL